MYDNLPIVILSSCCHQIPVILWQSDDNLPLLHFPALHCVYVVCVPTNFSTSLFFSNVSHRKHKTYHIRKEGLASCEKQELMSYEKFPSCHPLGISRISELRVVLLVKMMVVSM
jgi:hypothetical protein